MPRSWRAVSGVLVAVAAGCDAPRDLRVLESAELVAAVLAEPYLDRAAAIGPQRAPIDPRRLGVEAWEWAKPDFNDVAFEARRCAVGGRELYFVSHVPRTARTRRYEVCYLDVAGDGPPVVVAADLPPPPMQTRLGFGVQVVDGGLVLVHPDGRDVVERRAELRADGIVFGAPRVVARSSQPIESVQLTRTDLSLHVLWTGVPPTGNGDCVLGHARVRIGERTWSDARELTGTARVWSAAIAAGARSVYVGWSDTRFRKQPDLFRGVEDDGRLLVVASQDDGRSWSAPVMPNPVEGNVVHRVDLVAGRDGVCVSWPVGQPAANGAQRWTRRALAADLSAMAVAPERVGTRWGWR